MYVHVVEYINSLTTIAGKRWMEGEASLNLLTPEDRRVVTAVTDGKAKNDASLAHVLYGATARIDERYRKRITHVTAGLSKVIATCTLSSSLDDRRRNAIICTRHLCVGEALLRTSGQRTSRLHLLEVLPHVVQPELVWYAPPVHFALAFYDAVNKRGQLARLGLQRAQEAATQAMTVSTLLHLWVHLSIPLHRKSDLALHPNLILRATTLLAQTAKRPITSMIGIAAARLATAVSQLTHDVRIGVRWLERSRVALVRDGIFTPSMEREYHAQLLFLYETNQDYTNGIAEAQRVVELCKGNPVHWFAATFVVQQLQLRSAQYRQAMKTTITLTEHRQFTKQPALLVSRIRLHGMYARVLANRDVPTLRALNGIRPYPLESIILRTLIALRQNRSANASDAMHSLRRHVDRSAILRGDRALWLLTRLLTVYANNGHVLRACRRTLPFRKYEAELATYRTIKSDNTTISPLAIWKAIIVRL